MKRSIKIEMALVVIALGLSVLTFAIEPGLTRTTHGVDEGTISVGWPFVYKTTTAGPATAYTGPTITSSTGGLVLDWLVFLVVIVAVLNFVWLVVKRFRRPPDEAQKQNS